MKLFQKLGAPAVVGGEKKKKLKFRRRQVKKALIIGLYAFVAVATVIGIASPAFK